MRMAFIKHLEFCKTAVTIVLEIIIFSNLGRYQNSGTCEIHVQQTSAQNCIL